MHTDRVFAEHRYAHPAEAKISTLAFAADGRRLDINVEIRSKVSGLERMVSEAEGTEHN